MLANVHIILLITLAKFNTKTRRFKDTKNSFSIPHKNSAHILLSNKLFLCIFEPSCLCVELSSGNDAHTYAKIGCTRRLFY